MQIIQLLILIPTLAIFCGCKRTYKDYEVGTFEYHLAAATETDLDYCIRLHSLSEIIQHGVGSDKVASALIQIITDTEEAPALRVHAMVGLGTIRVKSFAVKDLLLYLSSENCDADEDLRIAATKTLRVLFSPK